jgi:putative serine protease PepD
MIRHRARLLAVDAVVALAGCSMATAGTANSSAATPAADVSPSALALQRQFVQVVKQVGPSVVLIQTSQGLGSGADSFQVTLADGKQYPARLVGSFAADDLAVLHIDAGGLHPAGFADSSKLQVGDVALAIGNPWGCSPASPKGSSAPSAAPSTRTTGSPCPT